MAGVEFGAFVDQLAGWAAVNRVEDVPLTHALERVVGGEHAFDPEFEEAAGAGIEMAGTRMAPPHASGPALAVLRATGADQVRP